MLDARLPVDEIAAPVRERVEPLLGQARAMTVWDDLVGQRWSRTRCATAAGGHGMSHAWLFTGPPGSGRSNAAVAFAAALQCESRRTARAAAGATPATPCWPARMPTCR